MQQDELRELIREAIAEQLNRSGPRVSRPELAREPREEVVSIASDAELAGFVRRLLDMTKDPQTCDDISTGRLKFKLAGGAGHQMSDVKQVAPPQQVVLPRGIVTERQVNALPEGTTHVVVGKGVRLTPLARDRLHAMKLYIENIERVVR